MEILGWLAIVLFLGGAFGGAVCLLMEWDEGQLVCAWAGFIGLCLIFVLGKTDDYERKNERIKATQSVSALR
jgi:hypothetical protein